MGEPKILIRPQSKGSGLLSAAPDFAWLLFGWIGVTFAAVGGVDVLLTWYPAHFGNAEWEFGTVTASLNGLPLFTMGLALLLGAQVAQGWRLGVRIVAALFLVVAVLIVLAAVLWATNVPLALQAVPDSVVKTGLEKAVVKTAVQAVAYPVGFVWIALKALGHARSA
jgi:hypothetical protein